MDYKEKYEQVIERLKDLKWAYRLSPVSATIDDVFPELAESSESEDEKIIYDAIKEVCNVEDVRAFAKHNETVFNVAKRVLEKQGKKKPVESPKAYYFHGVKLVPKYISGDLIRDKRSGERLVIESFSYDTGLYTYDSGQFPITIQNNYELVEQKPEWSEEDNKHLQIAINYIFSAGYLSTVDWLKSLKGRCVSQPKKEWSEEDEKMVSSILWHVEDSIGGKYSETYNKISNWLNSLKDRVLPQPKQEWSEEDEELKNDTIQFIENGWSDKGKSYLVAWLKSLRPQKKQEWSKEDEEMFATISDLLWEGYKASGGNPTWEEIRDWFRANYPQKQWKPSEGQIKALDFTVNYLLGEELFENRKSLEKLLEQLKAL